MLLVIATWNVKVSVNVNTKLALVKERYMVFESCRCVYREAIKAGKILSHWRPVSEFCETSAHQTTPESVSVQFEERSNSLLATMATPGPLGPNLQGMDSLTAAMKTNIIPDQEYLLQVCSITINFIKLFVDLYIDFHVLSSLDPYFRVQFWTRMWKTWIIDSEGFATMLMLVRKSSKKKRWFSASEGQARFPWHWGFVTAWTQIPGFPGNWGNFQIQ